MIGHNLRRGDCPFCGYSMTGIRGNTCPECGETITAESYARARPTRLEWSAIIGLLVCGFALSVTGVLSVIGVPMLVIGIVLLGSPGQTGPSHRRRLRWLLVAGWLPIAIGAGVLLWLGLRWLGVFP